MDREEERPPPKALRSFWPYLSTRRRPPLRPVHWIAALLALALAAAVLIRLAEHDAIRPRGGAAVQDAAR